MIVTLLGVLLALPVGVAAAAQPLARAAGEDTVVTTTNPPPTESTAPRVPLDKPDTEADKAESKRKLIMGVSSVILLGVVIYGRSVRRKKRKAVGS
jgi:hypothetical protein